MNMRQPLFTIFLLLLMAGCSGRTPTVPPVSHSATVQINQSYDSLPNYSRIYFQGGKQIAKTELDRWSTYCRLHVYNPDMKADYVTSVAAGKFEVVRVRNQLEVTESSYSDPDFHATPGSGFSFSKASWGGDRFFDRMPSYYLYRVNMKLVSPDQPDVQSLICSRQSGTYGDYYPTLGEIRLALGNLIEIIPLSTASIGSGDGLSSASI
jgi:hypothetical protein